MRERFTALVRLVAWTVRAEAWRSAAAVGAISSGYIATLTGIYALKLLVDAASRGDMRAAVAAGVGVAVALTAGRLLAYPVVTVGVTLRERGGMRIERRLMELVSGAPGLEHHERPEYLDELELVRRQRDRLSEAVASLVDNVAHLVLVVGTVVLLAGVHPVLMLLPAAAVVPFLTAMLKERQDVAFDRATTTRVRLARRLHEIVVSPRAAMELRLFGLGARVRAIRMQLHGEVERERLGAEIRKALTGLVGDTVFVAARVVAIIFIVVRAVRGEVAPGDVLLTIVLAERVRGQVTEVIEGFSWLLSLLTTVGRLIRLTEVLEQTSAASEEAAPDRLRDGITLDDVWFRYPGTDTDVLRGVSLEIPAGSRVAVVGENGAGKTTICKLLLRFYDPSAGRITVDGRDLAAVDPVSWRLRTSAAFQDFARLELLAGESVGVGDVPRLDDPAVVEEAMRRGGGADLTRDLPEGLQTQLGRLLDEGVELSGGGWQKVALARTMMRTVPPGASPGGPPLLLVLDEPTASLDAAAEHELFERWAANAVIAARHVGAVTLFVSHRFSTVRMADRIIVLHDGQVAEDGSHEELMRLGGIYAELYELQSRAYR